VRTLQESFSAELTRVRVEHAAALGEAKATYERKVHNWRTADKQPDRKELEKRFAEEQQRRDLEARDAEGRRLSMLQNTLGDKIAEATEKERTENAELRVAIIARVTDMDNLSRANNQIRCELQQTQRTNISLQRELDTMRQVCQRNGFY
jgi:hypothetical protein